MTRVPDGEPLAGEVADATAGGRLGAAEDDGEAPLDEQAAVALSASSGRIRRAVAVNDISRDSF